MRHDHEHLQQAIIGSLIVWPDSLESVAAVLQPSDFYNEKCRVAYQYLLEHEGGDFVTVSNGLQGKITSAELCEWMALDVSAAFLPRYCKELKEISVKLDIFDEAGKIRTSFQGATSTEMLDQLESLISRFSAPSSSEPMGAPQLVLDATRRLRHRYDNRGIIQGIPYGWNNLDAVTNGMYWGELIIVAGRPSMGKSAFASNILENVCSAGYSGMMFSLEMDKGNVIDRMIASRGGILYANIRSGNLQDSEWARNTRASQEITEFKLSVDDTPAISLREIKSKSRKQKRTGLDLVVIDYLQLIAVTSKESRTLAIGEVSRGCKQMARELDCVVVLLSQLNRSVDSRPDKKPQMSDLRDSGEIEQDADVILFPYRPAAYCPKCKAKEDNDGHRLHLHQSEAEIIIEKQRNGERNISVPVVWAGRFQRFEDVPA